MKVVILAGGFGTRISEDSDRIPKPMIEIGNKPIIWHIMKLYSYYGFNDFIICCGYKGNSIKDYFANYFYRNSDITFSFKDHNRTMVHNEKSEPWNVTLIDTGLNTMTGGRIKRIEPYIDDDNFLLTYGDGLSDVNISRLVEFHLEKHKIGTITAIQPESRFGYMDMRDDGTIASFREKSKNDVGWINGGFMVFNRCIFNYLKDDTTVFEREPLEKLAIEGQLQSFKHYGFWHCMDTLRDKRKLQELWDSDSAPWRIWHE